MNRYSRWTAHSKASCWAGLSLVVMLLCVFGCGSHPPPPGKPLDTTLPGAAKSAKPNDRYPIRVAGSQTLTLAAGVHMLGGPQPSAVYVIETSAGLLLIDSGSEELAMEVRESLLELGLRVEDVRYILITHAHYDHVFGVNQLRGISAAKAVVGRDDAAVLRNADMDSMFSVFPEIPYSGSPIEIDQEIVDGDRIELGDVVVTAMATPGHTPGSTCYLIEKQGQRILASGDVIASMNFGPATYAAKLSPRFRGDPNAFLATIDRLLQLPPPDLLLTGHPRQQTRAYPSAMDVPNWKALLEPARDELIELLERQKRDGADFLDGQPKQIESNLYYLGDLDGTAVYCRVLDGGHYLVNAPGGEQYLDFVTTGLANLGLTMDSPAAVMLTTTRPEDRSGLVALPREVPVFSPAALRDSLAREGIRVGESDDSVASPFAATELGDGVCYQYSVDGKTILFTPAVPRHLSLVWRDLQTGRKTMGDLQPQMNDLINHLLISKETLEAYGKSLRELKRLDPDVWLPSLPLTDQGVNLYDGDWQELIEINQRPVDNLWSRMGPPQTQP